MRRRAMLLAVCVCCVAAVVGRTGRAIKYQAFSDQALSRPVSQGPAANSDPGSPLGGPATQPQTTNSNALWNRRGAVAISVTDRRDKVTQRPRKQLKPRKPVLNLRKERRSQIPFQKATEHHSTAAGLPAPVPPFRTQNVPTNGENVSRIMSDVPVNHDPNRLGSVEGQWPATALPEGHAERRPAAPLPTQDLLKWLKSLLPAFLSDELFSAPCRISRSDPAPNEPLHLLEEMTGTSWRFPRTVQELTFKLMRLAYSTHGDQWGLIKLLVRDAVDYSLWEFVTEEEVERVGSFLSRSIVDRVNRLTGSVRHWLPTVPHLDAQQLMPQPRITRRFDTDLSCQLPSAQTILVKIVGAKALSMALHALTNKSAISDGVLRYQRRSVDDRFCQLTILGLSLDGVPGLCRGGEAPERRPGRRFGHRRKRSLAGSFHPFSLIVKAWNDFETNHYPIYDTVTRVMFPVLVTLPLLLIIFAIGLFPIQSTLPKAAPLETLLADTLAVLPAIERQEEAFGDDDGQSADRPLDVSQASPGRGGSVDQADEDRADGAITGISPRVEEQETTDATQDAVPTEEAPLAPVDPSEVRLAGSAQHSEPNVQVPPTRAGLNGLVDQSAPDTDRGEETDDVLTMVRAILSGDSATQGSGVGQPLFPLSLRFQREADGR